MCAKTATSWALKELALSMKNVEAAFNGCHQLSVSADPSDYAGEDTMVSVLYRPDTDVAATGPIQVFTSAL